MVHEEPDSEACQKADNVTNDQSRNPNQVAWYDAKNPKSTRNLKCRDNINFAKRYTEQVQTEKEKPINYKKPRIASRKIEDHRA